jgi:acetyltransferase-like isoleucine patch superfamily enzyme
MNGTRRGFSDEPGLNLQERQMLSKWFIVSVKRSLEECLFWFLDWSFFYEPPFGWIKARALNWFLHAKIAPDCLVMHKVRAANWSNVTLGSGALLADRAYLRSHGPISIGQWSMIGPEALLASGGHRTSDLMATSTPINIGKGVFVGARALILEGVTIGDHAMIGGGTTVARDVPPLAIVVGNPGRIIGYRNMPEQIWSMTGVIHFPRVPGATDESPLLSTSETTPAVFAPHDFS